MNLKKLNYRSYSSTGRANPWKEQNYADFFQGLTKVRALLRPQKTTEKEARTANRRLAQWRVTWLIEHSTSHQLLWCIDSFVLRNPPLRQAPNRYRAF